MTPEQIQIAIAEACGWTKVHWTTEQLPEYPTLLIGVNATGGFGLKVPDYYTDLNALHEAAILLCKEKVFTYCVTYLRPHRWSAGFYDYSIKEMGHAYANTQQEALSKAFLRTLNLWVD